MPIYSELGIHMNRVLSCFEDWYIEHVLLNRRLAGALRSLLGMNVGLPGAGK